VLLTQRRPWKRQSAKKIWIGVTTAATVAALIGISTESFLNAPVVKRSAPFGNLRVEQNNHRLALRAMCSALLALGGGFALLASNQRLWSI